MVDERRSDEDPRTRIDLAGAPRAAASDLIGAPAQSDKNLLIEIGRSACWVHDVTDPGGRPYEEDWLAFLHNPSA